MLLAARRSLKASEDEFVGDFRQGDTSEKMWVQIKDSQNVSGMASTYGKENLGHTAGRKPSRRSCGMVLASALEGQ